MTHKVNQLSRYSLSEREALRAFEALKRTPEFFRRYLQRYLAYAELGPRAALDDTLAQVNAEGPELNASQKPSPSQ
jgi:hypothetical protein